MKIKTSDLLIVLELLLKQQEEAGNKEFELPVDYYWNIGKEDKYNPYAEPKELTMGQLTDDWKELKQIQAGESQAIGYALVWLGQILIAIGEEYVA